MPIHDSYARIMPFELVLPEKGWADERFPRIQEEAEARGVSLSDPDAFPLLGEAGAILREIRSEEGDPRLMAQFGAILFQAFHFWQESRPLYLLETGVVRFLVDTGPGEGMWDVALPGKAGYVQFPQHLVWASGGEGTGEDGEAPESLDGFFWSAPDGENLTLLLVMGMRRERPGLVVVPFPTLPLAAAGPWASLQVRPQGKDFESSIPGAELEHLYALEAGAEAVKFAMRVFWYLDSFPGSVADGVPGAGESPQPTSLPYRRIVLSEG